MRSAYRQLQNSEIRWARRGRTAASNCSLAAGKTNAISGLCSRCSRTFARYRSKTEHVATRYCMLAVDIFTMLRPWRHTYVPAAKIATAAWRCVSPSCAITRVRGIFTACLLGPFNMSIADGVKGMTHRNFRRSRFVRTATLRWRRSSSVRSDHSLRPERSIRRIVQRRVRLRHLGRKTGKSRNCKS